MPTIMFIPQDSNNWNKGVPQGDPVNEWPDHKAYCSTAHSYFLIKWLINTAVNEYHSIKLHCGGYFIKCKCSHVSQWYGQFTSDDPQKTPNYPAMR